MKLAAKWILEWLDVRCTWVGSSQLFTTNLNKLELSSPDWHLGLRISSPIRHTWLSKPSTHSRQEQNLACQFFLQRTPPDFSKTSDHWLTYYSHCCSRRWNFTKTAIGTADCKLKPFMRPLDPKTTIATCCYLGAHIYLPHYYATPSFQLYSEKEKNITCSKRRQQEWIDSNY